MLTAYGCLNNCLPFQLKSGNILYVTIYSFLSMLEPSGCGMDTFLSPWLKFSTQFYAISLFPDYIIWWILWDFPELLAVVQQFSSPSAILRLLALPLKLPAAKPVSADFF
jgi:hypothetical protein